MKDIQNDQCDAVDSDFVVIIPPGGCEPGVVRSDLLAEQNVPVFCQLNAIRVNPLIKTSEIKSISFKGDYPEDVAGISFHPAGAAIRSYNSLVNTPVMENIGYVVIVLKQQRDEREIPEYVFGNLTATIHYDAQEAFGVGRAEFYLPTMSEQEWFADFEKNSFWSGKGFARVLDVDSDQAKIGIYTDKEKLINSFTLKKGETSNSFYFPGFYCNAKLRVKLNDVVSQENKALLNINGDQIWVQDGSRILDNRCSIKNVKILGGEKGKLDLSCSGNPRVELSLLDGTAMSWKGNDYSVGDYLFNGIHSGKTNDWYLAHVGDNSLLNSQKNYVVILGSGKEIESKTFTDVLESINALKKSGSDFSEGALLGSDIAKKVPGYTQGTNLFVLVEDETLEGVGFSVGEIEEGDGSHSNEDQINEYYVNYETEIQELLDSFPQERSDPNLESSQRFGESALLQKIVLLKDIGDVVGQEEREQAMQEFLDSYPDSEFAPYIREQFDLSQSYYLGNAQTSVRVNNEYYSITVERFDAPSLEEKSVELIIGGVSKPSVIIDEKIWYGTEERSSYLLVKDIQPGRVSFSFYEYSPSTSKFSNPRSISLNLDKPREDLGGKTVLVSDINVKNVAKISIIPEVRNTKSEAEFTFRVGIEDRAIKISPEKANEMIEDLDGRIDDLDGITEDLGELIEGWKGVCLATSGYLNLKNLAFGSTGESLARVEVMKYYRAECDKNHEEKSRTECYNDLEDSGIKVDVAAYTRAIKEVNKNISGYEDEQTDTKDGIKSWQEDIVNEEVTLTLYGGNLDDEGNPIYDDEKKFEVAGLNSWQEIREYLVWKEIEKDPEATAGFKEYMKQTMSRTLAPSKESADRESARKALDQNLVDEYGTNAPGSISFADESSQRKLFWSGKKAKDFGNLFTDKNVESETPVQIGVGFAGKAYYVVLKQKTSDSTVRNVETVYEKNSGSLKKVEVSTESASGLSEDAKFANGLYGTLFVSGGTCAHGYDNPEVHYYEIGANKGMPAIVPFDLEKGWYVKVSQSAGGILSSEQKGFDASGAVNFFYICNVGPDGVETNTAGDDICQSFNVNTLDSQDSFGLCSLGSSDVRSLVSDAQRAIQQAQSQYGGKSITINGKIISTGTPFTGENEQFECQDFMSPSECKLMFNACDPVICPSSRCDFGGKYPVSNVVASGIVGSTLLCLPNFDEGVIAPVCLTGIHAGLDSYSQILKSERECLQEGIETGAHTGICDEITAVYECEFFWRQAQPMLDTLVPIALEGIFTGNWRASGGGGGEYLTFQSAWENTQKSLDFFTDQYAGTTFRAINYGDVQEIGSEFCGGFIGTSFPTSAEVIDSVLEPESPPQFYAQFSEIPFTDATVPATSQYKVFYQIYAGKQQGVQYAVYLKDPPQSSYYANNPQVSVDSGFIAAGTSASESIDFTSPQGYKQLCVVINGQEECGFKQVSTSFAADYLHDQYILDQADNKDISSEQECISGTPSVLGLANTNPQAGFEEATQPSVDLRGLVRVCATANPGEGVELDRWEDVGNCGNSNIQCWLDKKSIAEDTLNLASGVTLKEAEERLDGLGDDVKLDGEGSDDKLGNLRTDVKDLEKDKLTNVGDTIDPILDGLAEIVSKGNLNRHQAEAMFLRGEVYRIVLGKLFDADGVAVSKTVGTVVENVGAVEDGEAEEAEVPFEIEVSEETSEESGVPVITLGDQKSWLITSKHILFDDAESDYVLQKLDNGYEIISDGFLLNNVEIGAYNSLGRWISHSSTLDFDGKEKAQKIFGSYTFNGSSFTLIE